MQKSLCLILLIVVSGCSDSNDPKPNDIEDSLVEFETSFEDDGPLQGFTVNNESALNSVRQIDGRYHALVTDNEDNKTLHFNESQGRLDAVKVDFPFEVIATNIGIGVEEDSQTAPVNEGNTYIFCGVQVHDEDLDVPNSSHVVVGHRGNTSSTIEGKNTVEGESSVNDIGANEVPSGRADIRIVGDENGELIVYWRQPNSSNDWTLYNGTGLLPGTPPIFGSSVYVGLITYAFEFNGLPFVGTCDKFQVIKPD